MTDAQLIDRAKKVIDIEIAALNRVKSRLNAGFCKAVQLILNTKGRLVVTGIGKSGLIGRKISATLSSTGTPSVFLHPVEAMHGDLGMLGQEDCILAISNSGETQELISLLPIFKARSISIIALTGGLNSTLARESHAVIDVGVEREACSLGLAPTASTTAALAVGDALAVVLLELRNFDAHDFRRNHPAGSLGEALRLQVREVMLTGDAIPKVRTGLNIEEILCRMNTGKLGCVLVLNKNDELVGIITDGDIRRGLLHGSDILFTPVERLMTKSPKSVPPSALAADALALMERHLITVLPVVENGRLVGIVHLHDLLGKGQFKFSV
ncbi:MAG: KpsF/GutQ family sugar-phosphate isomerase [Dissulfuribacterales bacterium]